MSLLWFILIGVIAGWLAGNLIKGGGFGLAGDLILGVIGSIVGGFLFGVLGFQATHILGSLITATVGAVVSIGVLRAIKQRT